MIFCSSVHRIHKDDGELIFFYIHLQLGFRASNLCKMVFEIICTCFKVEDRKTNLNEYKRIISRRHLYEFGVWVTVSQIVSISHRQYEGLGLY